MSDTLPRKPMRTTERVLWGILALIVASPLLAHLMLMLVAYQFKMNRITAAIAPEPIDVERYEKIRGVIAKEIGKVPSDIEVFDSFHHRGLFVIIHVSSLDLKKKHWKVAPIVPDQSNIQLAMSWQPDLYLGPAVIPDSTISIPDFGSRFAYDSRRRVAAGSYSDSY